MSPEVPGPLWISTYHPRVGWLKARYLLSCILSIPVMIFSGCSSISFPLRHPRTCHPKMGCRQRYELILGPLCHQGFSETLGLSNYLSLPAANRTRHENPILECEAKG